MLEADKLVQIEQSVEEYSSHLQGFRLEEVLRNGDNKPMHSKNISTAFIRSVAKKAAETCVWGGIVEAIKSDWTELCIVIIEVKPKV